MDFSWARFIGGPRAYGNGKRRAPQKQDPQRRLERFNECYDAVLQSCARPQALRTPGPTLEHLYYNLKRLNALLNEELRAPSPHLCFSHSATSHTYNVIGRAASACRHEGVIYEAIAIFGSFLDSGSEAFAASRTFARALMRFAAHTLDAQYLFVGEETEAQLLEVLFGIAAKIRLDPDLLPIWFSAVTRPHLDVHESSPIEQNAFVGRTQNDDFPLCYFFIDRVHHQGRIGDFARTGLLYIFECASRSEELESWIIASDIPTLMASALGALYSQLSRELSLRLENHSLPILFAMTDYAETVDDHKAQSIHTRTHTDNLATFLSALVFWQDVLEHCTSALVRRTLLDHFQILFLQQLLYPSILQSSDTDGGSSVAVMTYITNMLETLHEVELVEMILDYLFAVQRGTHSAMSSVPASPTVDRRRSFLLQSAQSGNLEDSVNPSTFNLTDMLRNALASQNSQTLFAALNLYSTIASRHPRYTIGPLVSTLQLSEDAPQRTIGVLESDLHDLLQCVMSLGDSTVLNKAYSSICLDVRFILQAARSKVGLQSEAGRQASRPVQLALDDVSLTSMCHRLESFLTNDIDVNLALTQAFMGLITCYEVKLDGLLGTVPRDVQDVGKVDLEFVNIEGYMDEEERAAVAALISSTCEPDETAVKPRLISIVQSLTRQIGSLRTKHPRFDYMLAKRSAILIAAGEQRPTSSAGLSDFTDDENQQSQRNDRSASSTPRTLSVARTPRSMSTTPRGRHSSQQTQDDRVTSSGSPTPTNRGTRPERRSSFMSPSRLASALFGSSGSPSSSTTASSAGRQASPAAQRQSSVYLQPPSLGPDEDHEGELLKRKISFPLVNHREAEARSDTEAAGHVAEEKSLSHVLTNIVVLRNFVLELTAVLQLRAVIFDEVRFT